MQKHQLPHHQTFPQVIPSTHDIYIYLNLREKERCLQLTWWLMRTCFHLKCLFFREILNGISVTDENGNNLGHSTVGTLDSLQDTFRISSLNVVQFIKCLVWSPPVESCSKRHHSGGRLSDQHGCTRNEYAKKPHHINIVLLKLPSLKPSSSSFISHPPHHHAENGKIQVHAGETFIALIIVLQLNKCAAVIWLFLSLHRGSRSSTDRFKWCWWECCK